MEPQKLDFHQHPPQQGGILERMASLETAMYYERRMTSNELGNLSLRISHLEGMPLPNQVTARIDLGALAKIVVAVLLPLLVLLASGDRQKAAKVSGIMQELGTGMQP